MKKSLLLSILGLTIGLTSLAIAGPYGTQGDVGQNGANDSGQMTPQPRIAEIEQALRLSPAQQDQFRAIVSFNRAKMQPLREQTGEIKAEVRQLLESSDLDTKRLSQLVHKQADLKLAKMINRHDTKQRIESILTTEQQDRLTQLEQDRAAKRRHHRQQGQKPQGPFL